jgi:hypothetical protein
MAGVPPAHPQPHNVTTADAAVVVAHVSQRQPGWGLREQQQAELQQQYLQQQQQEDEEETDSPDLVAREAALTASYERLYRQQTSTSSSAHVGFEQLEREVSAHNSAVRRYDLFVAARNRQRLFGRAGGLVRLRRAGSTSLHSGVRLTDLSGSVRGAHQDLLRGNSSTRLNATDSSKSAGGSMFAQMAQGLVSAAEAGELRRLVDAVGFRPFIRAVPEASSGLSKREPKRTHTACVLHSDELAAW